MAAASLRALLTRSIDYAGMFPPCSLELEPALKNQAEYVRSADSWMLSAFVLPIAKFGAAARLTFAIRQTTSAPRIRFGAENRKRGNFSG